MNLAKGGENLDALKATIVHVSLPFLFRQQR